MLSKNLTVVNPVRITLKTGRSFIPDCHEIKCDVIIECGEKRIIAKEAY